MKANVATGVVVQRSAERFQAQLQEPEPSQAQQRSRNGLRGILMITTKPASLPLTYKYLCSMGNLTLAWRKARKNKTKKSDVTKFEENLVENLIRLHHELKTKTYKPQPLKPFILREPKTRKISVSDFRDRVVHHALLIPIKPEFEKSFYYDSCANQIGKGTSFALKRLNIHIKNVTNHYKKHAFCLKADIKHYFEEVDHEILLKILKTKIEDKDIIWLIEQILKNGQIFFGGMGANAFKACLLVIILLNFSQTSIWEDSTIL